MFGTLIDYWYYTGDETYNNITTQGLLFQVGPYDDYMPPNQTLTEGNDDQGFWGMSVMTAAEYNFPNPPSDQPQWLELAQAVFNTQAARWDSANCNGGLRWQIFRWNNGYDYKNSISQACLFNLGARLALYTGNSTYAEWATKTWDWMVNVKFIDEQYYIYDGAHTESNCTSIVPYQFSYNPAAFILGAAAMYAYSNSTSDKAAWHERLDGLINGTDVFFFSEDNGTEKVMIEIACEGVGLCDLDQRSFKAYLSRWMAAATKWAPWTYDTVQPLLADSAVAAAKQCTGGTNGRLCGLKWANNSGEWDGTSGVGQQMAALEVVLANMVQNATDPVTNSTGGTSVGSSSGGGADIGSDSPSGTSAASRITTGDKGGAIFLTVIAIGGLLSGVVFMFTDETLSTKEQWHSFQTSLAAGASVGGAGAAALARREEKGKGVEVIATDSHSSSSGDFNEKTIYEEGVVAGSPTPMQKPRFVLHRITRSSSDMPMRRTSARAHERNRMSVNLAGMGRNYTAPDLDVQRHSAGMGRSFTSPDVEAQRHYSIRAQRHSIREELFGPGPGTAL
jgi:mannan endo-1,6-alpha-mannosidase